MTDNDRSTVIKSESITFFRLFCGGRFIVPWHQRRYDWQPKQVQELLRDVDEAISAGRRCYFLGTVILVESADRQWHINDGQQRIAIRQGTVRELEGGSKLVLLPSGHMLGSCQAMLEFRDGVRCGYSGDFSWPLDQVMKVDELVVDGTYGSPAGVRRYTQEEAESCLLEIVLQRLRYGSVHINAHRGTVERVLHVLGGDVGVPILGSARLVREVAVYQEHGFAVGSLETLESPEGRSALKARSYVRLYSKGDGFGNERTEGTSVDCSAYMVRTDHPLLKFSDRAYRVALSNHADFEETLAYVEATGARTVVTDNTRNHGIDLAIAINNRLEGVRAEPSTNAPAPS